VDMVSMLWSWTVLRPKVSHGFEIFVSVLHFWS